MSGLQGNQTLLQIWNPEKMQKKDVILNVPIAINLKKISLASQSILWLSMLRKTNQCIIKFINFAIHLTPYLDLNNKVSFIDQPIRTVQIKVNSGLLGRMDSQGQMFVVVSFRTKVIWWHGNGLELLQDLCYFIETSPIHALVIL